MPVMDGYDATRKLRQDSRFAALPVIAMTANAMVGDKEKCLAAGMNDFIAKPIDVAQLFATLARWVKVNPAAAAAAATAAGAAAGAEAGSGAAAGGEAAASARAAVLPMVPGLKMEAALQRMGGNAALMRKLLERFIETQIDAMARIAAAIDANDVDGATRMAHTVKGLAGNLGASGVADSAARVEQMLGQGVMDGRGEALDSMGRELEELVTAIALALDDSGAAPASMAVPAQGAVDMQELAAGMQEMARLLAQDDSAALKSLDLICPMLAAAGQGEHSRQLRRQLTQYDFEGALEQLREAALALHISL